MDVFWLIPLAIVVIPLLWALYAFIRKLPLSSSIPRVLLDKPADELPTDKLPKARDWAGSPCSSYLDWLSEKD
jgi:hypothetical protein